MIDMCNCGHIRLDHVNQIGPIPSGRCGICKCMKFFRDKIGMDNKIPLVPVEENKK